MQIKRAIVSLALLCVVTTSSQILGAEGWLTNWEEAKKTAAKEKKDILIDFTGSDWCGWCIKLKNEVFTKDQFKKEAPKDFVLLELDFPRSKPQAPELKKQNASLRDRFGIQGYPTIMLVEAKGRPFARTGYQPGGPKNYLSHLTELRGAKTARDKAFAAAEKETDGAKRAKQLDDALTQLQRQKVSLVGYEDVMQKIIDLDKDNKAGLRAKYFVIVELGKADQLIKAGQFAEAAKALDNFVANDIVDKEGKQRGTFLKAQAYFRKGDVPGCISVLEEARKIDPNSPVGRQIPSIIKQLKAQSK